MSPTKFRLEFIQLIEMELKFDKPTDVMRVAKKLDEILAITNPRYSNTLLQLGFTYYPIFFAYQGGNVLYFDDLSNVYYTIIYNPHEIGYPSRTHVKTFHIIGNKVTQDVVRQVQEELSGEK